MTRVTLHSLVTYVAFIVLYLVTRTASLAETRSADALLQVLAGGIHPRPSPTSTRNKGLTQTDMQRIVDEHNRLRKTVMASNMRKLTWDPSLAATAQLHADKCRFEHSKLSEVVGENIWAAQFIKFSPSEAVHAWYDEVNNRSCPCGDVFSECCGHYSQVMWAETSKVGCGYAVCPIIFNGLGRHHLLVCHYSPVGNLVQLTSDGQYVGMPIFVRRASTYPPCYRCPNGTNCEDGLCVD